MPRHKYSTGEWVLLNPPGEDATDLLVVKAGAAATFRIFSFNAEPAPETYGYAGAFLAPRWVVEFLGSVAHLLTAGADDKKSVAVLTNAAKLVLRGCERPDFAAALFVVLMEDGIKACAGLVGV